MKMEKKKTKVDSQRALGSAAQWNVAASGALHRQCGGMDDGVLMKKIQFCFCFLPFSFF
jgi:hypothetical protein